MRTRPAHLLNDNQELVAQIVTICHLPSVEEPHLDPYYHIFNPTVTYDGSIGGATITLPALVADKPDTIFHLSDLRQNHRWNNAVEYMATLDSISNLPSPHAHPDLALPSLVAVIISNANMDSLEEFAAEYRATSVTFSR